MIQELRGLGDDRLLDDFIHVERIEIERLSGGYDDDHDAADDGAVVYLRLYDQFGGTMRAAGSATVELFDLSRASAAQSVGRVDLSAKEMTPLWHGRFLTNHYSIKIPWTDGARGGGRRKLTAVVRFTDRFSGRILETEAVIEVDPGPRE